LTTRQVKRPSKRSKAKPPRTPPTTGPVATFLSDGLAVDWAWRVVAEYVEVEVNKERNVEPSAVTREFVVTTRGGGVVTTTGAGVVDELGDVSEAEAEDEDEDEEEDLDVVFEEVDESVDEIELEEHEDPKRVVNTVTGTSTVNVAGTLTVVVLPGRVINEVVIVG
jgi:hypothetical protein